MGDQKGGLEDATVMVTGSAGFIGFHLVNGIAGKCKRVVGIDNFNDYYSVELKEWRLQQNRKNNDNYIIVKGNIEDKGFLMQQFHKYQPSVVVHLAAQAGVRYSIENPDAYIYSNVVGFYNILEACRRYPVKHLVYASSSSVYGANTKVPFCEDDKADHPVSLYAATKKGNELLAYSYSQLYKIPCTGLRFFTVYGPAGRPDMAYFSFTEKLRRGGKIKIFNHGNCKRDFTYVDDIVNGIARVMQSPPEQSVGEGGLMPPPYRIYNIGNNHPENLMDFVHILSEELAKAEVINPSFDIDRHIEKVPMQPGDVPVTYADTGRLERDFGYKPSTSLRTGLRQFAQWYKAYYME